MFKFKEYRYEISPKSISRNLTVPELVETALKTEPCRLTDTGALLVETGKYTGRSPKDRFIVDEPGVPEDINWGKENVKISIENYNVGSDSAIFLEIAIFKQLFKIRFLTCFSSSAAYQP